MVASAEDGSGIGTRFGKYQLLKKLASGGMGEVFLAKQVGPVGFEKLMVIKRILAQHADKQSYVQMFFSEARLAALLTHSNIVQIFDMGEEQNHLFIAMEYVHGRSLRDLIDATTAARRPIPVGAIIEIGMQLCGGLSYAHNMVDPAGNPLNIVHRDINPHNVLISYHGEVKLIDFGIAKSDINEHKTETGTIKGKYVYMSPEQSAAEPLDRRSDIFALGIVFYEMCTGGNPFHHPNIVQSLEAIQRKDPPPVDARRPDVSIIAPIIHRMLAKEARDRFSDCAQVREAFAQVQTSGKIDRAAGSLPELMSSVFSQQMERDRQVLIETSGWGMQAPRKPSTMPAPRSRPPTNASRMTEDEAPAMRPSSENATRQAKVPAGQAARAQVPVKPAGGTYRHKITAADPDDPFPDSDPTELNEDNRKALPSTAAAPNGAPLPAPATSRKPQPKSFPWVAMMLGVLFALGGGVGFMVWRAQQMKELPPEPKPIPPTTTTVTPPEPKDVKPAPATEKPAQKVEKEPEKPAPVDEKKEKPRAKDDGDEKPEKPVRQERAERPKSLGQLVVTAPGSTVNGASGRATVELSASAGTVKVAGPFVVTLKYTADKAAGVQVNVVESEPWAIITAAGVGLGKAPQYNVLKGRQEATLTLKNPKVPEPMEITIHVRTSSGKP